jgi:uncharacterized protein (TIGR03437 family)
MLRVLFVFSLLAPLNAQLLVDTFAGGQIPPGAVGFAAGLTWDSAGNLVFCDTGYNVIRRLRPDGTIETIAGGAITGFSGDGGPASAALIDFPEFPAYDASGNLYFLDAANNRIRRIDTTGVITTIAGDGQLFVAGQDMEGPATARSLPIIAFSGMGVDGTGNVYLSDNSGLIRRVTPAGNLEVLAQVNSQQFMAVDPTGNVYVFQSPDLLRISPNGAITHFVTLPSPNGPGPSSPSVSGLATDPKGNVYVSGVVNGLLSYSPDGSSKTIAVPTGFAMPMAIDAQGNIAFETYAPNTAIQEFTAQSTLLKSLFGANPQRAPDGTPLREAWFLSPRSIAFSRTGDLYIAESGACLIRKISAAGVLSTFAGTGICGNSAPSGNAKAANLVAPSYVAVDSQNRVWVYDSSLNLYSIGQDGSLSGIIKSPVGSEGMQSGGLAVDSKDMVYVLSADTIKRRLANGTFQEIVKPPTVPGVPPPGTVSELTALGVDPSGNVYFQGDSNYNVVNYMVNDDGTFAQKSLNPVPQIATSLAVDASGNIWQADFSEIDISGKNGLGRFGNFRSAYNGDGGFALSAGFTAVSSMAFSPDGDLYFLDSSRIRRFTGSGPASPPAISQNGIVNAASYIGGAAAIGEVVAIFGSNFGASSLQVNSAVNNSIPFELGRTRVLFNNLPAAITALTPDQINVFVPYSLGNGTSANVVVQVDDVLSAPVTLALAQTAPGVFTLDDSGEGQGLILNQDGSINTSANPAPRGSTISLFGTGEGAVMAQLYDGSLVISTPFSTPVNPVSVTIGGQPAADLHASDAPSLPSGVFEITATVPTNITPGPAIVLVTVGSKTTTQQVTVAVK